MKVHVLVPAAGAGKRIGASISKQYLNLGDRPILAHTLARLAIQPQVTSIHIIAPSTDLDYCREEVVERYQLDKIGEVIAGGVERSNLCRANG